MAWLVFVAALLVGCAREQRRPDVILISIDCLNARQFVDAMEDGSMAGVRAVAQEALVFTRAYAHAPWTTPSHMSMLTGLYPSQHGRDVPAALQVATKASDRVPHFETAADRLAAAGYETAAFVGQGSISAAFGLGQGFQTFHESPRKTNASDLPRTDDAVNDWLIHRKPGPFFLFLHTYDLHDPRPPSYTSDEAALRSIDSYLGDVVQQLRNRGVWDDALVFITGDHGSAMIHTAGKCCIHGGGHYEENLHVPLLLKLPRSVNRGETDRLARHVDILPTILDVLGLPVGSYDGPGVSLLAILRAEPPPERVSYSEADAYCALRRGLVNGRFNYIYTARGPEQQLMRFSPELQRGCPTVCDTLPTEEFYDLETDPWEERNLVSSGMDAEQARWLDRFRAEMERHLNLPREYARRVVTEEVATKVVDQRVHDALKALGYVQ